MQSFAHRRLSCISPLIGIDLPGKLSDNKLYLSIRDVVSNNQPPSGSGVLYYKRMHVGSEIHRQYQASTEDLQSEVYIKYEFEQDNYEITIKGRIDGILSKTDCCELHEIKSVSEFPSTDPSNVNSQIHHYYMQLMLYAYLYSKLKAIDISKIIPKLILIQISTKEEKFYIYKAEDLSTYVKERVQEILNLYDLQKTYELSRNKTGEQLQFPYSTVRKYQSRMIQTVEKNLGMPNQGLMISAPTGIGKTVAALFPALKYALTQNKRVFFCHSRTTQQRVVIQTLKDIYSTLSRETPSFFAICLTAKEKLCLNDEKSCNPETCEYLKNYHFPSTELLSEAFEQAILEREWITEMAQGERTCPFELSLDLCLFADIIVGDYNYVFNPQIMIKRLFAEPKIAKQFILIIDEAHSLYNRALGYYSPMLPRILIEEIMNTSYENHDLNKAKNILFQKILFYFDELRAKYRSQKYSLVDIDVPLLKSLQQAIEELAFEVFYNFKITTNSDVIPRFNNLFRFFLQMAAFKEENIKQIYNAHTEELQICCLDAAPFLSRRTNSVANVIAMSATLTPQYFFNKVLGMPKNTELLDLPSPFPVDHRLLLIDPRFSTKYNDRKRVAQPIAQQIIQVTNTSFGNYFVFFPSFEYLEEVKLYIPRRKGWKMILQEREMNYKQKNAIFRTLEKCKKEKAKGCLVLAVLSGVFAEGVDYPNSLLRGIIVISPGTLQPSFERELIRKYYDSQKLDGFNYAYIAPGINRVIQAAGRLIRSEEDKGIIYLIEKRFTDHNYTKYFPSEWYKETPFELVYDDPITEIENFWKRLSEVHQSK